MIYYLETSSLALTFCESRKLTEFKSEYVKVYKSTHSVKDLLGGVVNFPSVIIGEPFPHPLTTSHDMIQGGRDETFLIGFP